MSEPLPVDVSTGISARKVVAVVIRQGRTRLSARKANGVKLGRAKGAGKSKLDKYREEIIALLRNGSTKVFVTDRYGTSEFI
jgi:hypothetical protein